MESDQDDITPPSKQVFSFIENNDLDGLRGFLKELPDSVNATSFSGSPLAVAINHNNVEAARILLDAGANPLGNEWFGNIFLTTLEKAAARGNRDILRLLLARLKAISPTGIVIHDYNESELMQRAMLVGATFGHASIVAEFLNTFECSDDTSRHALGAAAGRWEADVVDLILQNFQFEKPTLIKALHEAIEGKFLRCDEERSGVVYHDSDTDKLYRVVTRLIDEAGIDVCLAEHGSPLLRMVLDRNGQQGALRALLDKGVDPNIQWEDGCTALHLLASPIHGLSWGFGFQRKIHEAGIRVLREKGALTSIINNDGETASQLAAERAGKETFVRYFLPADGDLLSANQYGETLLHYAAAGGQHETVEFLLSRGIFDVNATTSNSWTPLHCALAPNSRIWKGELQAIKSARALIRAGADTNAVTAEGWTVLHLIGSHEDISEQTPATDDLPFLEGRTDEEKNALREPGVSDDTISAAALTRELLTGSWELPPIQSPAKVCRPTDSEEHERKRYETKDAWGGRLSSMFTSPSSTDDIIYDRTPLHWAAERGAAGVARVLRELRGADDDAMDSEGKIPWDLAHRSRFFRDNRVREATKKAVQ